MITKVSPDFFHRKACQEFWRKTNGRLPISLLWSLVALHIEEDEE